MFEQNYDNLLKQLTLQSIAKLIGGDGDMTNLIFALLGATSSRQIVGHVQFEDSWQCKIDESDTWYVLHKLKVAPHLCAIAYRNGGELNQASWDFAMPNVNTLEVGAIPKNAIEYLAMGRIRVDIEDDKDYAYECLNNVLESIGH